MTPSELTRLKEICEKATPGPWYVQLEKDPMINSIWSSELPEGSNEIWTDQSICALGETVAATSRCGLTNAQFIAEARTALPKLIEEVERLKKENAHLVTEVENIQKAMCDYNPDIQLADENSRLRERVAKMREQLSKIVKTQCPHFKNMKKICTCVYEHAYIALAEDDEMEIKTAP